MKTDKIAAMTMVYGSERLLKLWVEHYGRLVGHEHLCVISHGDNPVHREICQGLNHIVLPRAFDKTFSLLRTKMVTNMVDAFLSAYHAVVFTDVDEFIALDPAVGMSFADYLRAQDPTMARAPIGLNVVPAEVFDPEAPKDDAEAPLSHPLRTNHDVVFAPHMCKPMVTYKRTSYIHGFHGTVRYGPNQEADMLLDPNLVQFHLKYIVDYDSRYKALTADLDAVREQHPDTKNQQHWKDADDVYSDFVARLRRNPHLGQARPADIIDGKVELVRRNEKPAAYGIRTVDGKRPEQAFTLPPEFRELI